MTYYRKKPVVIEATQWFSHGDHPMVKEPTGESARLMPEYGIIETLEGPLVVSPGDWIITGVKGEHYACKPDVFNLTYERADPKPHEAIREEKEGK